MNKETLIIILVCGILIFNCTEVSAQLVNKVDISDVAIDNIYKIKSSINLNQFSEREILVDNTVYNILNLPNYGHTSEIGKPTLPTIRFLLAVPSLSNISLKILKEDHSILPKDYLIYPVQEPVPDSIDYTQKFTIDSSFYSADVFYPDKLANIGNKGILRDYKVIQLEIFPFQYNPVTKRVRFYSNIILELEFNETPTKYRETPLFDDLYRSVIYNYDSAKYWPARVETVIPISNSMVGESWYNTSNGADYLIITNNTFYKNITLLANWKEEKGLKTEIINMSDINDTDKDGVINDTDIYTFINYTYHNWALAPIYVLLVGM